jgi:hypothetical protein
LEFLAQKDAKISTSISKFIPSSTKLLCA